uniref:transmembrane and coiled-coil domains protein 2-like isoform X2 n=1 Tax=Myxine glutinosa TaxID=7769 RepID=UPI00358EF4F2
MKRTARASEPGNDGPGSWEHEGSAASRGVRSEGRRPLSPQAAGAASSRGPQGSALRQLLHSRRRTKETQLGGNEGGSLDMQEQGDRASPELQRVLYATSMGELPSRSTAFNKVLQQIQVRPERPRKGTKGVAPVGGGPTAAVTPSPLPAVSMLAASAAPPSGEQVARPSPQGASSESGGYSTSSSSVGGSRDLGRMMLESAASGGPEASPGTESDKQERLDAAQSTGVFMDGSLPSCINGVVEPAASGVDGQRARVALEQVQQKMLRITERIRIEQEANDENVAEYLKLSASADKQQTARIKNVFEKRNQKSAATISQLQRKLEHYHRRVRELEQGGGVSGPGRQPRAVLRDVQQGLRDVGANMRAGISGLGGGVVEGVRGGLSGLSQATQTAAEVVVQKPREFFRHHFGSEDNLVQLKDLMDDTVGEEESGLDEMGGHLAPLPRYGSDDDCSSATSAGSLGAESTTVTRPPETYRHGLETVMEEIRKLHVAHSHLEHSLQEMKTRQHHEFNVLSQTLQEQHYRYEWLEEQLGDLSELHQNEVANLTQELASMEEKVAYHSYEFARDIQVLLTGSARSMPNSSLQA